MRLQSRDREGALRHLLSEQSRDREGAFRHLLSEQSRDREASEQTTVEGLDIFPPPE